MKNHLSQLSLPPCRRTSIRASESIAMHFGTFQMTAEGIDEPVRGLEQARRAKSVRASASDFGFRGINVRSGIVPICVDEAL
jgi:hypothetical protein